MGSARGSAWLCHWVQQLLQLLPSCARQLQTFVTVVLQEGGRKGGGHSLGSHEGILRTSCPHEWQRMVNAMLLLTGSITFFTLRFTALWARRERTSELREVRPGRATRAPFIIR